MVHTIFSTVTSFCLGMMLCIPALSFLEKEWNKYTYNIQEVVFPKHPVVECLRDTDCRTLAEASYYEARGESDTGVVLVMQTIVNRVEHKRWGTNIRDVVYEPYQFSYTHDGSIDKAEQDVKQWIRMYFLAYNFLQGNVEVPEEYKRVTHYLKKGVNTKWYKKFDRVVVVGNHIGYECKRRC